VMALEEGLDLMRFKTMIRGRVVQSIRCRQGDS
jgi:hypothetical protein